MIDPHSFHTGPLRLTVTTECWQRREPFQIAGYVFDKYECVVVELAQDHAIGRGEAFGVYYHGENCATITAELERVRPAIEAGLNLGQVQTLLPAGGARNALDCALWELTARLLRAPASQLAGVHTLKPLVTTFTCGADDPERMAAAALAFPDPQAIKLKLTGDELDAERVRVVRAALPDIWLSIDANQGFTRPGLEDLMPVLESCAVRMIEQPYKIGQDALLDGFRSPIPIAADESVQTCADIPDMLGRYDLINIKLDKSGGLTEALRMVREARRAGLGVMVGCMGGTSLAMAPAFIAGQLCDVVDLDGPVSLSADRAASASYVNGCLDIPHSVWGHPGEKSA